MLYRDEMREQKWNAFHHFIVICAAEQCATTSEEERFAGKNFFGNFDVHVNCSSSTGVNFSATSHKVKHALIEAQQDHPTAVGGSKGVRRAKKVPPPSFASLKLRAGPDHLKMRLRFRGSCWDEAPTPATPPPIPLSDSGFGQPEDPPRPLRDLVQSEGLEAPCPHRLLRRPQPVGNLSSWSCTVVFRQCWTAHDRGQPLDDLSLVRRLLCLPLDKPSKACPKIAGCTVVDKLICNAPTRRLGVRLFYLAHGHGIVTRTKYIRTCVNAFNADPAACKRSQDDPGSEARFTPSQPSDEHGFRHHQHPAVQALTMFPACCVITSDPTTALLPELTFPKVMLTDRSRRASLFSLTQTMLSAIPEPSSLSRSKEAIWRGNAGGVGAGRSLVELLPRRTSPHFPAEVATGASASFREVLGGKLTVCRLYRLTYYTCLSFWKFFAVCPAGGRTRWSTSYETK